MSFVIAVLGFGFLVFIHELGHFLLARLTGMKVEKFSIGFGPALYKVVRGETVYQIALLPFGGYVQIKGLMPEPGASRQAPAPQLQSLEELEREWGGANEVFSPVEEFEEAVKQANQEKRGADLLKAETEEERSAREDAEQEGSYSSKSLWSRFLVVSAGPAFNAIFTLIVFAAMFSAQSAFSLKEERRSSLVINDVSGAAHKAGILPGDVLLAVDDQQLRSFYELRSRTIASEGRALKITVARPPSPEMRSFKSDRLYDLCAQNLREYKESGALDEGEEDVEAVCGETRGIMLYTGIAEDDWRRESFTVIPENIASGGDQPMYRIGVAPEMDRFGGEDAWTSIQLGWAETAHLVKMMGRKIWRGVRGEERVEVASVVKITAISVDTVEMGNEWFLSFLAFLSLNLAFLNLLPFPALDGGRLIFLGIEAVSRRPVPPAVELIVNGFGIVVLLGLTLWITALDILSLL